MLNVIAHLPEDMRTLIGLALALGLITLPRIPAKLAGALTGIAVMLDAGAAL